MQNFVLVIANANRAPVITSTPIIAGTENELYSYTVTATDPDGDALSFAAGTLPAGMTFDGATAAFSWTPGFEAAGSYALSVTAMDGKGGEAIQAFTLVVANANRAPVITSAPVVAGKEGDTYSYAVTATDADGDALSFAASTLPAGMVFDAASATFSWTPSFEAAGSYPLTVTVTDGKGGEETQAFTLVISNANRAPAFTSDPVTSAKEGDDYSYVVSATDPDGDDVTISVLSGPEGMVMDASSRRIQWTPSFDAAGDHDVSLRAADGQGGEAVQTFTIHVADANRAPHFTSAPITTGREGEAYQYVVAASDPDGDALAYTVSTLPTGMSFDPTTRVLSWIPGFEQAGSYTIGLTVTDGRGGIDNQSFTLVIADLNRAPSITSQPVLTGRGLEAYSYQVVASDPDGDVLTYSLALAPAGMAINSASGLITWTPAADQVGASPVHATVTDGRGGVDEQSFSVQIEQADQRP